jgi:hypothetical protein
MFTAGNGTRHEYAAALETARYHAPRIKRGTMKLRGLPISTHAVGVCLAVIGAS